MLGLALGVLLGIAAVARVYRGGTTLNDHAVAAQVALCMAVYPALWLGSGASSPALGMALLAGGAGIYGLFHVLDLRRDPGRLVWLARWSQPAYAFSLWTGLLLVVWAPVAPAHGERPLWPGGLLLLPLALAAWGTAWTALRSLHLRVESIPGPALPRPLRVVHLSDLHASPCVLARDLERLVARTNACEPDLVVVTGDLVMPFSEDEHAFLLDALARIRAPVVACPGNHDVPVSARLGAELGAIGARWLVDEAISLAIEVGGARLTVEVAGVAFHWTDARAHFEEALGRLPAGPADLRLLLAHDPRLFAWVPEGRFDLVLSGHTHGGQVGTDMFGLPGSVLRLFGVFDQGLFRRGAAVLNVSRGTWDVGLPPRLGIASEVVLLRIGGGG